MYYYIINTYKDIGFLFIQDDHFIAIIGSFGFIAAGLGRLFIGKCFDIYPWKKLILIITSIECFITIILYYAIEYNKYLYAALIVIVLFLDAPAFLIS